MRRGYGLVCNALLGAVRCGRFSNINLVTRHSDKPQDFRYAMLRLLYFSLALVVLQVKYLGQLLPRV